MNCLYLWINPCYLLGEVMDSSEGDIPIKGKRYNLRSRPWDSSYMEVKEDPDGQWVFDPIETDNKKIHSTEKSE